MTRMEMVGHVQFTVNAAQLGDQHADVATTCRRMRDLFANAGIPATWAVDRNHRYVMDCLAGTPETTEIALQAPPLLLHLPSDRVRFERWLVGALHEMRGYSAEITSLFVPRGDVADVLDILVGHGIRVVSMPSRQSRQLSDIPRPLRPGLLRVALSTTFPGRGTILGAWDPGYRAKAALAHAMRRQSSQQIVVTMAHFLRESAQSWRSLESVLQLTRLGHQARTVRCETLREVATRIVPNRARRPMQSILRAA